MCIRDSAYEMLTGSHPFQGKSAQQMMAAHVMETPPTIASAAPSVPPAIASLVMRCLEKEPAKRPQSADELLHLLDSAVTPAGTVSVTASRRRSRWKLAAVTLVGAMLLVVGGALAFAPRDKLATAIALMRRSPAVLHPRRIIVTPFENETGDPKLAPLGAMAADWLAQGLTAVGGVEVVDARTTIETGAVVDRIPWPFKSRDRGRALAEETGAGIVLSGAIYRDGDSLRIQARMTDAATGKLLRALTTVSGPASAPTKVFDQLNRRAIANVAQAMDTVASTLGSFSEPPSMEAYEETLKGIDAYLRQDTIGYVHLARAIALDSTYATPVVFLAFSRLYRGDYDRADSLITRAEKLRDRMAPADRAMLDHLEAEMRGDPDASLRTSEAFMRATPGSGESPLLVISTALATGKPRYALALLDQVDPNRGMNLGAPFYWFYKTGALNTTKQYDRALDLAEQGLRRFPGNVSLTYEKGDALIGLGRLSDLDPLIDGMPTGRSSRTGLQARVALHLITVLSVAGKKEEAKRLASAWLARLLQSPDSALPRVKVTRAMLLASLGRWDEALPYVSALLSQSSNDPYLHAHLLSLEGIIAAHDGNRPRAQEIEAEIEKDAGRHDLGVSKLMRARIAAHLGDRDRAVSLLTQAEAEGVGLTSPNSPFRYDPLLLPLTGYPPFEEVVKPRG